MSKSVKLLAAAALEEANNKKEITFGLSLLNKTKEKVKHANNLFRSSSSLDNGNHSKSF
jgi:hypothetical protein